MPEQEFRSFIPRMAETWIGTLCRLLISIQRYRHGGALLITRASTQLDIKYRITYDRLPRALRKLWVARLKANTARQEISQALDGDEEQISSSAYLNEMISESDGEDYREEITGCVRFISSLSCVDGLILATPNLTVRGFGTEIRTKRESTETYLSGTPMISGASMRKVNPNDYGTRHRSMMRYCFYHPSSVGFVVSQDGEIRAMTRVQDSLVLWENLKVLSLSERRLRNFAAEERAWHLVTEG
jgi:hypothetical protein